MFRFRRNVFSLRCVIDVAEVSLLALRTDWRVFNPAESEKIKGIFIGFSAAKMWKSIYFIQVSNYNISCRVSWF